MVVLLSENPADDVVAIELLIKVGRMDEGEPLLGITQMVQKILERRIEGYDSSATETVTDKADSSSGDIDRLEVLGARIEVEVEPDVARISLECLSSNWERVLDYLVESLGKRRITRREVNLVRADMLKSLQRPQGAFSQLYRIFRQAFYRYHPYRNPIRGSRLALDRMTVGTVQKFFNHYWVPNRMVLSLAGKLDRIHAMQVVKEKFRDLKPGDEKVVKIPWEPKATEKLVRLSGGTNIAWLFVGFPAPSINQADYPAMTLVGALLGEGLSSRLFIEIREKRSLAYELGSMYPPLRGPSHLLFYVITKPYDAGSAKDILFDQIELLRKQRVSVKELEESKRKVIGNYLLKRETARGRAYAVALSEAIGSGYARELDFIDELNRVTPADIQRVAKMYLHDSTLLVARPGGRIYLDL